MNAFFAASRAGEFGDLIELLNPNVVARDDGLGGRPAHVRGAQAVGKLARDGGRGAQVHPVLVNGTPGVVITLKGRPFVALYFTVVNGKIVEIQGIREPDRVRRIAAAIPAQ